MVLPEFHDRCALPSTDLPHPAQLAYVHTDRIMAPQNCAYSHAHTRLPNDVLPVAQKFAFTPDVAGLDT